MNKDKKYLIVGADGQLAAAFIEAFSAEKIRFAAYTFADLDITEHSRTRKILAGERPDVIINCSAYNLVDDAEDAPKTARAVNARAIGNLAGISRDLDAALVHYSTDYVFSGNKGAPYVESDQPDPVNIYGQSKLEGEREVARVCRKYLIFRLSWVFGSGKNNFIHKLTEWSANRAKIKIADDEISVPTYTEDAVAFTLLALEAGLNGLYHLVNSGQCSRYQWARHYFLKAGKGVRVVPASSGEFSRKARIPLCSVMSNARLAEALGRNIPDWKDAVDRYVKKSLSMTCLFNRKHE